VNITSSSIETIDIRLTRTISTAKGSLGDRSGIRVRLETADGVGFGESAPIPGTAQQGALESLATELQQWSDAATGTPVEELLGGLDDAHLGPLARFAAHTALADLSSQAADAPLHEWLRSASPSAVQTSTLVSAESPKEVHGIISDEVASGVRAIKLKVAAADTSIDATRIIAASEACGPTVELRLDANGSWTYDDTLRVIGRVGRHRISYLEDPTSDPHGFGTIAAETGVAIAYDVPVEESTNLEGILERTGATVLVVKPAAVGGIDRILDTARSLDDGQRLIVSSSIDGSVGLLAGLHAAAALPAAEAHGLGTAALVRNMPELLEPVGGEVSLPTQPGLGLRPDQS
jgi:o-succinylbenzoate synthase